jgi:hypothetical protein
LGTSLVAGVTCAGAGGLAAGCACAGVFENHSHAPTTSSSTITIAIVRLRVLGLDIERGTLRSPPNGAQAFLARFGKIPSEPGAVRLQNRDVSRQACSSVRKKYFSMFGSRSVIAISS